MCRGPRYRTPEVCTGLVPEIEFGREIGHFEQGRETIWIIKSSSPQIIGSLGHSPHFFDISHDCVPYWKPLNSELDMWMDLRIVDDSILFPVTIRNGRLIRNNRLLMNHLIRWVLIPKEVRFVPATRSDGVNRLPPSFLPSFEGPLRMGELSHKSRRVRRQPD